MGSDNIFRKKKETRKKRKENILKQKSSRWLIVCEGRKTEPNYFKGAVDYINSNIDEEYKLHVDIFGEGKNTLSLVESVDDILNAVDKYKIRTIPYSKIFVVFDKDSFDSEIFDNAIKICEDNGYIPLWSNQAIEYWFLLHFNFIDAKMDRKNYANKINEYFKNAGLDYKYKKNDCDIYLKLRKYGSQENAIKNAINIHKNHINDNPSNSESCTTVYKFFEEVNERLNELK